MMAVGKKNTVRFGQRESDSNDEGARGSSRPKIEAPKEKSPIEGVPLLQLGSLEEFMIFEEAFLHHVEIEFLLQGFCLRNNDYDPMDPPTQQSAAARLEVYPNQAARTDAWVKMLDSHWKLVQKSDEEKRAMFGALLSVISRASRLRLETAEAEALNSRDVLLLWRGVLRSHKSGTHHMSAMESQHHLQRQYVNARQMARETIQEYATRFKRIAAQWCDLLLAAMRPDAATPAYQFCC